MTALSGLNALLWVGAVALSLWVILHFVWMLQNLRTHRKNRRTTDLMAHMLVDDLVARVVKIEKKLKDKEARDD